MFLIDHLGPAKSEERHPHIVAAIRLACIPIGVGPALFGLVAGISVARFTGVPRVDVVVGRDWQAGHSALRNNELDHLASSLLVPGVSTALFAFSWFLPRNDISNGIR